MAKSNLIGALTLLALGLTAAAPLTWLAGFPVLAAVLATAVAALGLLIIVLVTAYVTRRNTIETLQLGADIALKAQHINDTWDAKKTKALADVMREGARMGRNNIGVEPLPALPLPSQSDDWLPDMIDLTQDDFEELN